MSSAGQAGRGEDRAWLSVEPERVVLVVADGAGGSGRGAAAAEAVVRAVADAAAAGGRLDPVALLTEVDTALADAGAGGETTAVVALVDADGVLGASVGDSEAWVVVGGARTVLTAAQERQPLVGSGRAQPVPFMGGPLDGTLLVGSDGLFKYAPAARLCALAREPELQGLPERLMAAVRLRSGVLPDDTTAIVCRPALPQRE